MGTLLGTLQKRGVKPAIPGWTDCGGRHRLPFDLCAQSTHST